MKLAQYAEKHGFEAVWQAESRLVRDAIVPMAAFAAVTERIKVGSGVINNWTRNIGLLAATFLTLDDLAPDRIICGIGAWWDPLAKNVGIDRAQAAAGHARDDRGDAPPAAHGERHLPRRVPSTCTASSWTWCTAAASRATCRSMIGATGLKMMELTGEIADGVVLNYCVPPEYNDKALEHLRIGRRAAPAAASTISTARSWSSARCTRTRRPRSTARAAC